MLDRVSTNRAWLDGQGGAERFADYSQWEAWQSERLQASQSNLRASARGNGGVGDVVEEEAFPISRPASMPAMEERVAAAERVMEAKRTHAEDPEIAIDCHASE